MFNKDDFKEDISLEFASHAFDNVSFRPDKRGAMAVDDYCQMLFNDYTELHDLYESENSLHLFDDAFSTYRNNFRTHYVSYLSAESRCISSAITGPANFPVRRAEKANDSSRKRYDEFTTFRERSKKSMRKQVQPFGDGSVIRSNDPDALAKLQHKLNTLVKNQEAMKAVNKIARQKISNDEKIEAIAAALGITDPMSKKMIVPNSYGCVGFAGYALANNNANIKAVQARIDELSKLPGKLFGLEANGVSMFVADGRIQIKFPDKPDEDKRARLRKNAFKWSPSRGTWVRQDTANARYAAANIFNFVVGREGAA
jgi:hypothetical protein